MAKPTEVNEFLEECDFGNLKEKLGITLSECALGTLLNATGNRTGKVTVEFSFARIGETDQLIVSHKIGHKTPTKRGSKSQDDLTETAMYVTPHGQLSVSFKEDNSKTQLSMVR